MDLPENLVVNLDDLTLGEVEDVEDLTGLSLAAISQHLSSGSPPMKVLRALIFVTLRRDHPDLAFEETRDIKLSALPGRREEQEGRDDADADPTKPPVASSSGGQEA